MSDSYNVFSSDYIEPQKKDEPIKVLSDEQITVPISLYGLSKPRRDIVVIRIAKDDK